MSWIYDYCVRNTTHNIVFCKWHYTCRLMSVLYHSHLLFYNDDMHKKIQQAIQNWLYSDWCMYSLTDLTSPKSGTHRKGNAKYTGKGTVVVTYRKLNFVHHTWDRRYTEGCSTSVHAWPIAWETLSSNNISLPGGNPIWCYFWWKHALQESTGITE